MSPGRRSLSDDGTSPGPSTVSTLRRSLVAATKVGPLEALSPAVSLGQHWVPDDADDVARGPRSGAPGARRIASPAINPLTTGLIRRRSVINAESPTVAGDEPRGFLPECRPRAAAVVHGARRGGLLGHGKRGYDRRIPGSIPTALSSDAGTYRRPSAPIKSANTCLWSTRREHACSRNR